MKDAKKQWARHAFSRHLALWLQVTLAGWFHLFRWSVQDVRSEVSSQGIQNSTAMFTNKVYFSRAEFFWLSKPIVGKYRYEKQTQIRHLENATRS